MKVYNLRSLLGDTHPDYEVTVKEGNLEITNSQTKKPVGFINLKDGRLESYPLETEVEEPKDQQVSGSSMGEKLT